MYIYIYIIIIYNIYYILYIYYIYTLYIYICIEIIDYLFYIIYISLCIIYLLLYIICFLYTHIYLENADNRSGSIANKSKTICGLLGRQQKSPNAKSPNCAQPHSASLKKRCFNPHEKSWRTIQTAKEWSLEPSRKHTSKDWVWLKLWLLASDWLVLKGFLYLFVSLPGDTSSIEIYFLGRELSWLVVYLTLWKIWVRQLGWWHSRYMENHKSHVPNHQPD